MSKSVRLKDHLVAEVERLASEERRSLAQMVEILLEQALAMDSAGGGRIQEGNEVVGYAFPPHYVGPPTERIAAPTQNDPERTIEVPDDHFKPDFGKKLK